MVVNTEAVTTHRDGPEPSPEPTDLKFVGPATAAVLDTASFDATGVRDREVSFGMLLDAGVNPGVAARIRREHSLPWSFETEADRDDLDRRSDQVRGLNDGERDWVAASTGDWAGDEPGTAEEPDTVAPDGAAPTPSDDPRPEGEWPETARPDETGDEPVETAAWPETARPDESGVTTDDSEDAADGVGPWPETARPDEAPATSTEGRQTTADGSGDPVEAETAWRERSVPVPVTELDGVDDHTRETLATAGITSVRSLATTDPAAVATALDLSERQVATLRETARAFLPDRKYSKTS